ncbi:hypothetical protein MKK67_28075 [Methylobacterium sp. J-072]|uniref:hypothetical protein n=1 Tax=Methylobacterium sp. J-072 TaxID=2836651 RepID=UPI001FB8EB6D|nr:hypothetical protein [Methylobacterium sp. J-072]MCJ2096330.1 hypothetical protein [Methylobacterium sp. J-072]
MPDIMISYDLKTGSPVPYGPFMEAAEKEGLLYVWKGAKFVSRLPNTTVWGVFTDCPTANAAFDRALVAAGKVVGYKITLEKRMTVSYEGAESSSNKRKEPVPKWTGTTAFQTSRLHQKNDPFFVY